MDARCSSRGFSDNKRHRRSAGRLSTYALTVAIVLFGGGLATLFLWQPAVSAEANKEGAGALLQDPRVRDLANRKGISAAEALASLRGEAAAAGPKLFEKHCAECHRFAARDGAVYGDEEPIAPDLTEMGSARWIAGWLDEEKIKSPAYFGNTAFEGGTMVDFVENTLGDVCEELAEEDDMYKTAVKDLVACLAAEARLDKPRKANADEETVEGIDEDTLFLFEDLTCTECHRFYHLGDLGDAPDLTGYMSREWLTGIIKNPEHERFYGSNNDGMPAFHKSADDCTLTEKQIDLLLDWMQGKWQER